MVNNPPGYLGTVRKALLNSDYTTPFQKPSDLIDFKNKMHKVKVGRCTYNDHVGRLYSAYTNNATYETKCHGILILGCNQQNTCKKRYKLTWISTHRKTNTQHTIYKWMHEMYVCTTKSLHCKLSTRNLPLECLTLARYWEGLELDHHSWATLTWTPHVVYSRNKPIKTTGILTISPFGYFVTKPPLTLIPHKKK